MVELNLEPCLPPPWAQSGHAQTILGHLLPSQMLTQTGRRVEVALPDGDTLVGFMHEGNSGFLVYIFHGLAGSTDATYMHRTARVALELGHSVLMMNHRSCGAGARLARHPYHSGRGEDLGAVVAWGREQFPRRKHLAIGFSLSGNALLMLLSQKRGGTLPDFAISVNAPINLSACSDLLGQGLNRIYDARFFMQCRRDVMKARAEGAKEYKLPLFHKLKKFDELYTAPAGGFESREQYYASCSTAGLLKDFKTPAVVLSADDDPFVRALDYHQAKLSPTITMHIEKTGGHMGYLSKNVTPLGTRRWQDYVLHESIRAFTR